MQQTAEFFEAIKFAWKLSFGCFLQSSAMNIRGIVLFDKTIKKIIIAQFICTVHIGPRLA
jgi:hypothetical protein